MKEVSGSKEIAKRGRFYLHEDENSSKEERGRLFREMRRVSRGLSFVMPREEDEILTLRPFLTKTPTQIPLTVPNPRSRKLRMLSASLYSPEAAPAAFSIGDDAP